MTNFTNSVLYTGITSKLNQRVWEHKTKLHPHSFTAKYNVNKLVYLEEFNDPTIAIAREKQIKGGSRAKKVALIRSMNRWFVELTPPDE